jgi:archaeosine synthase
MAGGIGKVVLHRDRFARCLGLGDRRNPVVTTPCLIQTDVEDLPSDVAPFVSSTSNTLPREMTIRSLLPLEPPNFDVAGPNFHANIGHVLPPSLDNADAGEKASTSVLLPVSWQRLHHDQSLTNLESPPEIVVLTDALQLAQQGDKLVRAILAIKKAFPSALLWAPAIGGPDNIAVLTWLGVDLFDLARSREAAVEKMYLTMNGVLQCASSQDYSFDQQLMHWQLAKQEVHSAFQLGTLRELAEQQALNSPRLVEHLRFHKEITLDEPGFLERHMNAEDRFRCYSFQSFSDPLIHDWVDYISRQYQSQPKLSKVLVLLPCSERKPYRLSKSHAKFLDILGHYDLEHLMVTSPLGIVPRSLEDVWPASHYDIPVTGTWTQDEILRIQNVLKSFLERHSFQMIINHSTIDINHLHEHVISTRNGFGALSSQALKHLDEAVQNAIKEFGVGRTKASQALMNRFQAIADKIMKSSSWLDDCVIRGKPPRWRIEHNGQQIAIWSIDRNAFSFSKAAIDLLHQHNALPRVQLLPKVNWNGDIFPHMVESYDVDLRKNDDVLVYKENIAIGIARVVAPGWEWNNGIGVLAKLHQKK